VLFGLLQSPTKENLSETTHFTQNQVSSMGWTAGIYGVNLKLWPVHASEVDFLDTLGGHKATLGNSFLNSVPVQTSYHVKRPNVIPTFVAFEAKTSMTAARSREGP
jgi:hypothetical protein